MTEHARKLELPWQRALVVGMGASGRAAAKLLLGLGVAVNAYDAKSAAAPKAEPALRFFSGDTIPDAAFAGIDLLVLSPGVPPQHARSRRDELAAQATVHGELSLTLDILARHAPLAPLCLITGTNGKSTITALIAHLLEAGGETPFAGGNLGVPLSQLAHEVLFESRPAPSQLILECSSYQLETLGPVASEVAILSNVSPDHLARYASMQDYARTKARVFAGLGEAGLALLDGEDPWTEQLTPAGRSEQLGDAELRIEGDALLVAGHAFSRTKLGAAGRHNAKNALFALRAALELGATPEACTAGLSSFEGLAHRMSFVRTHADVHYYDDSKATNVASVLAGLRGFDRPFVLIAGGQLKGEELTPLIDLVEQEGLALVALGEGKNALAESAGERIRCVLVDDMQQAVDRARAIAKPGQAVVLSPAGASWDMYANFGARGDHFASIVNQLR
jgi:UDP-N-acetylmuramoylalanine--D-glutamate ligase